MPGFPLNNFNTLPLQDSCGVFCGPCSRDEFVDLFLDDLELPDLAKRRLAEAESQGLQRAGY